MSEMRLLETTYYLEPAGSHGVWGLDDYHFLPFLFGASQLYSHPHLTPRAIRDPAIINELADEYIYFDAIRFILDVKTEGVGMRWHSPMLDDISRTVKRWKKVREGMRKMYLAEVLGKLAIMQHFMFGSILQAPDGVKDSSEETDYGKFDKETVRHVHIHDDDRMEDLGCCGIPVPSAVGAKGMSQKGSLRRVIPFD